jgi:hypothetical protein
LSEGVWAVAEPQWWSSWIGEVVPYAILIRLFVDGSMAAEHFEVLFLRLYKVDPTEWPPELFGVLDGIFADIDAYCADPEVRRAVGGLSEEELREHATMAFSRLKDVAGGPAV